MNPYHIFPHLVVLFKPGIGNVMDKTGGILSINTKIHINSGVNFHENLN